MVLLLICLLISAAFSQSAEKVLPLIQLPSTSSSNGNCKLLATNIYLAVQCPNTFTIYQNKPENLTSVFEANQAVLNVRKTTDQGISFIQGNTLNQFDSQGRRQIIAVPNTFYAFLTDSIYVASDSLSTLLRIYVKETLISTLSVSGQVFCYAATNKTLVLCTQSKTTCQFYDIQNSNRVTTKRIQSSFGSQVCVTDLIYQGDYVILICNTYFSVYQVRDYKMNQVFNLDAQNITSFAAQQSGNILNIYLLRTGWIQGIAWNVVDTVSIFSNSSLSVNQRFIYDRHQDSLSYKYLSHAKLHNNGIQSDLFAIDAAINGLYFFGQKENGFMINQITVCPPNQIPSNFSCQPLNFAYLDTMSFINGTSSTIQCRLQASGWQNALQIAACGLTTSLAPSAESYTVKFDVKKCLASFYQSVDSECIACPTGCTYCDSATNCQSCQSEWILQGGICEKCPSETYRLGINCASCPTGCQQCSNTGVCTQCKTGHWNNTFSCVPIICDDPYYLVNGTCQLCSSHCSSCESGTTCKQCEKGFFLDPVSAKCDKCTAEAYTKISSICAPCNDNCVSCGAFACLKCAQNYTNINGNCKLCESGTFFYSGVCQSCPSTCLTCQNSSLCTNCITSYSLSQGQCLPKQCDQGTYLNFNDCLKCPIGCSSCVLGCQGGIQTCKNRTKALCNSCLKDYAKNSDGGCVECAANQFIEGERCQNCSENCQSCNTNGCNICHNGSILQSNLSCTKCPSGTFIQNNTCQSCSFGCQFCTNQQNCLSCAQNYQLVSETTSCKKCNLNQYFNLTSRSCNQCGPNCRLCNSDTSCQECYHGFKIDRGICTIDCSVSENVNQSLCIVEDPNSTQIQVLTNQTENVTDVKQQAQVNDTIFQKDTSQEGPLSQTTLILIMVAFLITIVLLVTCFGCLVVYVIKQKRMKIATAGGQFVTSNETQSSHKDQISAKTFDHLPWQKRQLIFKDIVTSVRKGKHSKNPRTAKKLFIASEIKYQNDQSAGIIQPTPELQQNQNTLRELVNLADFDPQALQISRISEEYGSQVQQIQTSQSHKRINSMAQLVQSQEYNVDSSQENTPDQAAEQDLQQQKQCNNLYNTSNSSDSIDSPRVINGLEVVQTDDKIVCDDAPNENQLGQTFNYVVAEADITNSFEIQPANRVAQQNFIQKNKIVSIKTNKVQPTLQETTDDYNQLEEIKSAMSRQNESFNSWQQEAKVIPRRGRFQMRAVIDEAQDIEIQQQQDSPIPEADTSITFKRKDNSILNLYGLFQPVIESASIDRLRNHSAHESVELNQKQNEPALAFMATINTNTELVSRESNRKAEFTTFDTRPNKQNSTDVETVKKVLSRRRPKIL